MTTYTVTAGVTSSFITLNNSEFLDVASGGTAISTTVNSGGAEWVFSGGTASGTTVNSGGAENVSFSGTAISTTVNSGGTEFVFSGGRASATTVNSGGAENVSFSGTAISTTVNSGGTEFVFSVGTASGTVVSGGGDLVVLPGGVANATTVLASGAVVSTGVALYQLNSGITAYGSAAVGGSVGSGATEYILSGGTAISTTVNGGTEVVQEGRTSFTTVNNGGTENVGGTENALFGGAASFTTVNSGGTEFVLTDGTASGTTVNSGGLQGVGGNGTAISTTVNGGTETVQEGRTSFTTVNNGGTETVAPFGLALFTTVNSGGTENVDYNGTATSTTVNSGGTENLGFAGSAIDTIVNSAGTEVVSSGGAATSTTVNSGGTENVHASGAARGTTVNSGGNQIVSGIAFSTTLNSGGTEVVVSGGTASGTVLQSGGRIDVSDLGFASGGTASVNASTDLLTVTESAGTYTQQLSGSYTGEIFHLATDGTSGTLVTVACFAEGTHLATPSGETPVQALCAGDDVLALQDGAWTPARVRWVGRTTIDLARHPHPDQAAPIRICAHAVAPDAPARDLLVSPDHALFFDGRLIQARALLNGASVVQVYPARITYLHVELDRHAVLLAENLPAESYLDTGNRALFANEAGVRPLHPNLASAAAWDEFACAPLLLGGARVAAAHARVLARAVALGGRLTGDAAFAVACDGRMLALDARGRAMLPAGARTLALRSRSFVPAWLGLGDDGRRLGVAVASVRLGGRRLPRAAFAAGWHAAEAGWRWTDGAAQLTLPALARPTLLSVRLASVGARYWTATAEAESAAA